MKKFVALFATSALLLGACGTTGLEGSNTEDNGEEEIENIDPNDMVVGLSVSTLNNPFFVSLEEGVVNTAESEGTEVSTVDAQDDTAKQLNDVSDLIQQDVDVLLINPVDSAAIEPAIESANSAGIPVITIDRSTEGGEVVTLVASDNVEGGEMAAQYIIDLVGEGATTVQLEGVPGASATRERGEGFMNIAEDGLDVVDSQTANFNRSEGLTVMENMLQSNENVEAIFAQNDEMALGALEAIEAAGLAEDIVVVGFDGNDDAIEAIEAGRMDATIAQQPLEMGRIAMETAFEYFDGEEIDEYIAAPLELITNE
ncbi:MAG: D-ribose ABC transporter substrate-binding protein [Alkalibacterium gilvum]|uniref:Ribose transport system substrate-binding protein n=1 Tax=Alkalibacterium gilvum TaxID=1130080 RepID=A0A1H6SFJ9_9LACT|nr:MULTISPECIES: D-ribose ABC transporter substrate-binding protein [Alkalibacterium]MDN6293524.1 D-ribose ABC transporter substrate-binding protein [Alkalibacterium sp.]MDN6295234.1 D-ribose ABC transporter substrate-binding protein [Alkalibacterium sp.]MDN6397661.1 D-ribose ABC transporter substrate-binding protein [Alkalibacterium sp.]MDN6729247.1 D-ribose ABC transporter substrate-binding protein [Alkalibacterium sp.]SEI66681.1 ribose transport system substrate-binding protein [Alkalibacte